MNENTIKIVKSTAPLVKEHGEAITTVMYAYMFKTYPEVEKLFRDAAENQRVKLANAIYAYAANIDKLYNLKSGIEKIALAHVKTEVKPEHYPIVKESILYAFVEVLGNVLTKDIVQAWSEAYDFLANVLIDREKSLYAQA